MQWCLFASFTTALTTVRCVTAVRCVAAQSRHTPHNAALVFQSTSVKPAYNGSSWLATNMQGLTLPWVCFWRMLPFNHMTKAQVHLCEKHEIMHVRVVSTPIATSEYFITNYESTNLHKFHTLLVPDFYRKSEPIECSTLFLICTNPNLGVWTPLQKRPYMQCSLHGKENDS